MDRNKIIGRIAEKGFNLSSLAKRLNMPYQTLYRKINQKSEFTLTEACALSDILEIPVKDRGLFFLTR